MSFRDPTPREERAMQEWAELKAEVKELTTQRDALLAACKAVLAKVSTWPYNGVEGGAFRAIVRPVIAAVEESAS